MSALVATFVLVAAAMLLMAVGLLAGKRLSGSCGGKDDCACAKAGRCTRGSSASDASAEYRGIAKGPGDLSTSPKHLENFGK